MLLFYELFVLRKHDTLRASRLARDEQVKHEYNVQHSPPDLHSTISTMASVPASSSPITQVSQHQVPIQSNLQPQLLTRLLLDLRNKRFSVDRETIMNLPESVLLCLFPNGLVLSRQSAAFTDGGENEEDEEVYAVDVGFSCSGNLLSSMFTLLKHIGHSSTQNALHTSWTSSGMHRTRFMAPRPHPACSPPSSICWTGPPPTLALPPLRTHF